MMQIPTKINPPYWTTFMFGGIGKNRGFVRKEISKSERIMSLLSLFTIFGIGVAVYLKGQSFDPNLFALDQSLLQETTPARQQVKLYEETTEGNLPNTYQSPPQTDLFSNLAPDGWQPLGEREQFAAENLYVKINGRAEQYLAYDVIGLQCAGFANGNSFIDIFIYDMGEPENAFGIYSVERNAGQPPINLGREGYRVEASYFFWKGPYYVQIIASETGESIVKMGHAIAQKVADQLNDTGTPLWGLSALPEKDRIADTLKYLKKDALSFSFLQNTYTAQYQKDGDKLTLFIAHHPTAEEAGQTLEKYSEYLTDYGQVTNRQTEKGVTTLIGDMGGVYDIVFQQGEWVGGITFAENQTKAKQMVANWIASRSN